MKWYERAAAKVLPPTVTGGVELPRPPYRCPDCSETFTDSEIAFSHVMSHPGRDRRRTARTAAA